MENLSVVFEVLPEGSRPPPGYTKSSGHIIFDVRMTLERKTRWVKHGHKSKDPDNCTYITLIGSADVLVETKPEDRPIFEEDLTEEEREAIAKKNWEISQSQSVGDIVALQLEPGWHRSRDCDHDNTTMSNVDEMISYNRLVTGLPQWQIEEKLRLRTNMNVNMTMKMKMTFEEETGTNPDASSSLDDNNDDKKSTNENAQGLLGEVAMTMGMELRRAYVNSLAVLQQHHDDDDGTGTLVSGNYKRKYSTVPFQ